MKNSYEVRGDVTAIFLKKKSGEIVESIIDTIDLDKVNEVPFTWCTLTSASQNHYVTGTFRYAKNRKRHVQLHRYLLDVINESLVVDHINHDSLDNRRCNLRVVTRQQNLQNRKGATRRSKTGVRSVFYDKYGKFRVAMKVNKKYMHFGTYENIVEAEEVAKEARKKYMPYSMEIV